MRSGRVWASENLRYSSTQGPCLPSANALEAFDCQFKYLTYFSLASRYMSSSGDNPLSSSQKAAMLIAQRKDMVDLAETFFAFRKTSG